MTIGIERPGIRFEIVYGISKNKRAWYDNANAYRLGYQPQDDAEAYAAELIAAHGEPGPDDPALQFLGGEFTFPAAQDPPA